MVYLLTKSKCTFIDGGVLLSNNVRVTGCIAVSVVVYIYIYNSTCVPGQGVFRSEYSKCRSTDNNKIKSRSEHFYDPSAGSRYWIKISFGMVDHLYKIYLIH